ncbi:D-alanyl-lipoteichoic acid biosynthesis protein DltD [Lactobacillus sp. ESL0731]|uniref:D-alanyl-lipoteichoic acid biosynthesis protein DltD n=1 Tax=unclassified Lactobacillus TaxID=2620435 RepID=UPI0023F874CB|nr:MULTISPECIES: D-alanyl-lipoteichoic acid biosynthesis protein DltD [unclassified Lactobacillus]WEV51112.1 D-alanyl-lipoteichoic acid biosynthesis protein DltD [Lactobacillus sp. ESL0700]WEV62241.1 D-alanyl-lipoteichoic acid biosynthesis protein DltD [Lactobacillus sp. ESL0731]
MNNKRRLWQIFGPVLCAIILLLVILLLPWERTFSKDSIYQAANSQTTTIFKGSRMKQNAFDEGYVPFYGSSELSRMDPLHPSVLAEKYHRNYRPFLLGGPGSQSLAQFLGMQGTAQQLKSKKAVVIISPQWFTKKGQDPNAFTLYYSPLQACNFLLGIKKSTVTNRYAAKRFLQMPEVKGEIKSGMRKVAQGQRLSSTQRFILENQRRMLNTEDKFFSTFQLRDRIQKIRDRAKLLPKQYSVAGLEQVADEQAARHTNSNTFGINNSFYRTRLDKKNLRKLKNSQRKFDYTKSAEYSDFELMLQQFAKQHTNVLFIIPPINHKWASYTGLSQKMYQRSVSKIKYQLASQGFANVEDLSKRGGQQYFMEDTIHLGWRGWVAVDQAVKPFMAKTNLPYNYNIHNYFYTKKWQNKPYAISVTDKTPADTSQKESLKDN